MSVPVPRWGLGLRLEPKRGDGNGVPRKPHRPPEASRRVSPGAEPPRKGGPAPPVCLETDDADRANVEAIFAMEIGACGVQSSLSKESGPCPLTSPDEPSWTAGPRPRRRASLCSMSSRICFKNERVIVWLSPMVSIADIMNSRFARFSFRSRSASRPSTEVSFSALGASLLKNTKTDAAQ